MADLEAAGLGGFFADSSDEEDGPNDLGGAATAAAAASMLAPPERRQPSNLVGLDNQGATCYLNSLIQALAMCPEFRQEIFSIVPKRIGVAGLEELEAAEMAAKAKEAADDQGDQAAAEAEAAAGGQAGPDAQDAEGRRRKPKPRKVLLELQRLLTQLQELDQDSVGTHDLTGRGFSWDGREGMFQQDVDELNRVLLDAIDKSTVNIPHAETLIRRLYGLETVRKSECLTCGDANPRAEPGLDIGVRVKGLSDMVAGLTRQLGSELMCGDNKVECGTCGQKRDKLLSTAYSEHVPSILTMVLNRYDFNQNWERIKLTSPFEFPLVLDMAPFVQGGDVDRAQNSLAAALAEEQLHASGAGQGDVADVTARVTAARKALQAAEQSARDACVWVTSLASLPGRREALKQSARLSAREDLATVYDLYGVIIHSGGATAGHYTAYLRDITQEGNWSAPTKGLGFDGKGVGETAWHLSTLGGGAGAAAGGEAGPAVARPSLQQRAETEPGSPLRLMRNLVAACPKHPALQQPATSLSNLGSLWAKRVGTAWRAGWKEDWGGMHDFVRACATDFMVVGDGRQQQVVLMERDDEDQLPDPELAGHDGPAASAEAAGPVADQEAADAALARQLAEQMNGPQAGSKADQAEEEEEEEEQWEEVGGGGKVKKKGEAERAQERAAEAAKAAKKEAKEAEVSRRNRELHELLAEQWGRWFLFNDSRVTPIPVSDIKSMFGGTESGYILLYRSRDLAKQAVAAREQESQRDKGAKAAAGAAAGSAWSQPLPAAVGGSAATQAAGDVEAMTAEQVLALHRRFSPEAAWAGRRPEPPAYWRGRIGATNAELAARREEYERKDNEVAVWVQPEAMYRADGGIKLVAAGTAGRDADVLAAVAGGAEDLGENAGGFLVTLDLRWTPAKLWEAVEAAAQAQTGLLPEGLLPASFEGLQLNLLRPLEGGGYHPFEQIPPPPAAPEEDVEDAAAAAEALRASWEAATLNETCRGTVRQHCSLLLWNGRSVGGEPFIAGEQGRPMTLRVSLASVHPSSAQFPLVSEPVNVVLPAATTYAVLKAAIEERLPGAPPADRMLIHAMEGGSAGGKCKARRVVGKQLADKSEAALPDLGISDGAELLVESRTTPAGRERSTKQCLALKEAARRGNIVDVTVEWRAGAAKQSNRAAENASAIAERKQLPPGVELLGIDPLDEYAYATGDDGDLARDLVAAGDETAKQLNRVVRIQLRCVKSVTVGQLKQLGARVVGAALDGAEGVHLGGRCRRGNLGALVEDEGDGIISAGVPHGSTLVVERGRALGGSQLMLQWAVITGNKLTPRGGYGRTQQPADAADCKMTVSKTMTLRQLKERILQLAADHGLFLGAVHARKRKVAFRKALEEQDFDLDGWDPDPADVEVGAAAAPAAEEGAAAPPAGVDRALWYLAGCNEPDEETLASLREARAAGIAALAPERRLRTCNGFMEPEDLLGDKDGEEVTLAQAGIVQGERIAVEEGRCPVKGQLAISPAVWVPEFVPRVLQRVPERLLPGTNLANGGLVGDGTLALANPASLHIPGVWGSAPTGAAAGVVDLVQQGMRALGFGGDEPAAKEDGSQAAAGAGSGDGAEGASAPLQRAASNSAGWVPDGFDYVQRLRAAAVFRLPPVQVNEKTTVAALKKQLLALPAVAAVRGAADEVAAAAERGQALGENDWDHDPKRGKFDAWRARQEEAGEAPAVPAEALRGGRGVSLGALDVDDEGGPTLADAGVTWQRLRIVELQNKVPGRLIGPDNKTIKAVHMHSGATYAIQVLPEPEQTANSHMLLHITRRVPNQGLLAKRAPAEAGEAAAEGAKPAAAVAAAPSDTATMAAVAASAASEAGGVVSVCGASLPVWPPRDLLFECGANPTADELREAVRSRLAPDIPAEHFRLAKLDQRAHTWVEVLDSAAAAAVAAASGGGVQGGQGKGGGKKGKRGKKGNKKGGGRGGVKSAPVSLRSGDHLCVLDGRLDPGAVDDWLRVEDYAGALREEQRRQEARAAKGTARWAGSGRSGGRASNRPQRPERAVHIGGEGDFDFGAYDSDEDDEVLELPEDE